MATLDNLTPEEGVDDDGNRDANGWVRLGFSGTPNELFISMICSRMADAKASLSWH